MGKKFKKSIDMVSKKNISINISGSHKLPIKKRFVRNPDKKDSNDKMLIFQGTEDDHKPSNKDWIPAPVKKGKVKDTKYQGAHYYEFYNVNYIVL